MTSADAGALAAAIEEMAAEMTDQDEVDLREAICEIGERYQDRDPEEAQELRRRDFSRWTADFAHRVWGRKSN